MPHYLIYHFAQVSRKYVGVDCRWSKIHRDNPSHSHSLSFSQGRILIIGLLSTVPHTTTCMAKTHVRILRTLIQSVSTSLRDRRTLKIKFLSKHCKSFSGSKRVTIFLASIFAESLFVSMCVASSFFLSF